MTAMEEGWEAAERINKETAGGRFVNLKNEGDTTVGIFVGKPVITKLVYNAKTEKYDDWNEKEHGSQFTPRYKINFFVLAEGGKPLEEPKMKIFECNNTSWTNLLANKGKYGLDNVVYELKQSGAKGDTKRCVHILPEGPRSPYQFTESVAKILLTTSLQDLKKDGDDTTPHAASNGATNGASAGASDPVIDKATTDALTLKLKAIQAKDPKVVETFIKWLSATFGSAKIRELKVSQAKAAEIEIARIEPKPEQAAEPTVAKDPWD